MYGTSLGVTGVVGIVVVVAGIEALIRGRLLPFLTGVLIIFLIFTGIYLAVTNVRIAVAGALVIAALALLFSNLAGYLRRR
jgi:prepilin signal peptidase PulO-like enzyme (type II secretory pathway)